MLGATYPALSTRTHLLAGAALFAATAAFTVWRNTQVGVLIDIAYPLNTATRIAAGDVPYADFPLAHAPLHFLWQAALIKLFGPSFLIQIAYAALFSGVATALTYWIAARLLEGAVPRPRTLAAVLTMPLIPLGIYSIYPHPFYDSDACLAVLVAIAAILAARRGQSTRRWLLAGALATLPLLIKQNIGGAFLALLATALLGEALLRPSARPAVRWWATGLIAALAAEMAVIQLGSGLDRFVHWTWSYAMQGRGLSLSRIAAFADPRVIWPALPLLALALALGIRAPRTRATLYVGVVGAIAVASTLPSTVLAVPELFPPILIAASALALIRMAREGIELESALPLVVSGTALGALQSQGLAGSSFGIFPLLVLGLAALVRDLALRATPGARAAPMVGLLLAVMITVGGTAYTLSEQRLAFIDVHAPGPVVRSTFPSLVGLSARGPYLADLDALLFWIRDNVPRDEPMAFLPGEDPAFYALERRPTLPSVWFFDVANPVSFDEIIRSADEVGLRWVFVKERIQMTVDPSLNEAYVAALTERATLVAQVGPYKVYRRP